MVKKIRNDAIFKKPLSPKSATTKKVSKILNKKNKIELRPEAPLEIKSECLYNINYLIEYDKSLVKIIKDLQSKGIDHVSTLVNLCNYITHFRTAGNGDSISFKFHSVDAAYKTWTQLLSFIIFATIKAAKEVGKGEDQYQSYISDIELGKDES